MKDKIPAEFQSGVKGGKVLPALCGILGTIMILSVIVSYLPLTIPRLMGYEIFNVVSGSMEPEIPEGSAVYVRSIRAEDVQPGDVIAFESGGTVVTHRVVNNQVVMGEFTTKGDANEREDVTPVSYSALIGRVERHYPFVGRIMTLYSGTIGKIYALLFAGCGVLLNVLAARLRDRRLEREEIRERLIEELRRPGGKDGDP